MPRRLLDIGCSTGHWLEAGLREGWLVTGIELDPETARRTSERLGIPVHTGSTESAISELGEFDLVVMNHVIEHTRDPVRAIRAILPHLGVGGHLLVRVPNGESALARTFGAAWSWFIPPIHLYYFSSDSLERLATSGGLGIAWMRTVRGDAQLFAVEFLMAIYRMMRGSPGPSPPWAEDADARPGAGGRKALGRLLSGVDRLVGPLARFPGPSDDAELLALLVVRDPRSIPSRP